MNRDMWINDTLVAFKVTGLGAGVGPRLPATVLHRGRVALYNISGAANAGYSPSSPLYPGPTLSALVDVLPPFGTEAMRWDVDIARELVTDTLDGLGGVQLFLSSGAVAAGIVTQFLNPTNATAPPGYAVVGDGGLGYRFNARAVLGGPLTVDIPIAWPVPIDNMATVSFRILAATRTENQQFRCLVNGVEIFAQDLGDAAAPVPDVFPVGFRVSWRWSAQGSPTPGVLGILTDDTRGWWGTSQIFGGP